MNQVKAITAVLWVLVCTSAIAVVYSHHLSRQVFIEWQSLLDEQRNYEVRLGELLIEKSSLTAYSRLERLAGERLKMAEPADEQIIMVREVDR